ncbi:GlxA family transcriptional regulator [Streptomyces sp. NBC_00347]|uniref:GlxA family transcriptional regulator n=1 Tax=Streptomyces sp. NBC_00347 TaxID=2975721 RepID=UPI0022572CD1|nr:helix-turn-helix domain-containing protein [Streptomyces sp. NBC_00347]MCX5129950.1 helix-turn-helix domain-containing protein [Streptomyces sp. NBC_00347]
MSLIAVLALDGVPGHQLTTPGLVFGAAARHHPWVDYDLRICAAPGFGSTGGPAPFRIETPWGLEGLEDADTVLLPGCAAFRDEPAPAVVEALHAAAARGCRIGSVGTGTFVLAATGLLDGRRAATSRRHTEELARLYPRVEVDPDGAVVTHGRFHSAAGVLGGLDLCLRLVTLDHGESVVIETERQAFLQLHSPADDPAGDVAATPAPSDGSLDEAIRWMEANLQHPLTLAEIADRTGLGVRTLTRRFRSETGLSPLQYLLHARIQLAQRLLERTDDPIERIAARTGLGTPANLRHHFHRCTGTTPGIYRNAFRSLAAAFTWAARDEAGQP